jgi:hypothetical protein
MIGLILLFISILLYMNVKTRKYSILLFISFSYSGLRVLTDEVIGLKNIDIAIIYTCIICLFTLLYERKKIETVLDKWCGILMATIFICALFSFFHYGFSFMQILQGGRAYLILFSFWFLKRQSCKDIKWVIKILFFLTYITAILYVLQVVFKVPLLPYGETKIDPGTGLLRMYNEPIFLVQFIFLTCLFPEYVRTTYSNSKFIRFAPMVLLVALLLTQSRMYTFMSLAFLCIGLLIKGKMGKTFKIAILITIVILPLSSVLSDRIEGANTSQDLKSVFSGDYKKSVTSGGALEGSLSYRFAWVYERTEYLKNRPISEKLFGLGIISESQVSTINKLYRFRIGIPDPESGYVQQIGTPDISYGSFIASFGYLGAIVCILFWFSICRYLYKNRKLHPFVFSYSIYIMFCFVASFTGGYLIFKNLVMPFLLIALVNNKKYNISINTNDSSFNRHNKSLYQPSVLGIK